MKYLISTKNYYLIFRAVYSGCERVIAVALVTAVAIVVPGISNAFSFSYFNTLTTEQTYPAYSSTDIADTALLTNDSSTSDAPLDISLEELPEDPEPETCEADAVYTVDNETITELLFVLGGTRLQISHTRQGVPIEGELRTMELSKGITSAKFQELEAAQEERCSTKFDPLQCMADWYQAMSATVVHTIQPSYHSYVDWSDAITAETGLEYTLVPVPVVEKSIQKNLTKGLLTALVLPIVINVDRARCAINQIESVANFNNNTHQAEIVNGKLELAMPLTSVGFPTLKCEGRAVALWGLHSWGWADELFPDVNLTNIQIKASIGSFKAENELPGYSSAIVSVDAHIDLNNLSVVEENILDFIKDYNNKIKTKVAAALQLKLLGNNVREAFGRAIVKQIENESGESVARVCDVNGLGDRIEIEYERLNPTSVTYQPGSTLQVYQ